MSDDFTREELIRIFKGSGTSLFPEQIEKIDKILVNQEKAKKYDNYKYEHYREKLNQLTEALEYLANNSYLTETGQELRKILDGVKS